MRLKRPASYSFVTQAVFEIQPSEIFLLLLFIGIQWNLSLPTVPTAATRLYGVFAYTKQTILQSRNSKELFTALFCNSSDSHQDITHCFLFSQPHQDITQLHLTDHIFCSTCRILIILGALSKIIWWYLFLFTWFDCCENPSSTSTTWFTFWVLEAH